MRRARFGMTAVAALAIAALAPAAASADFVDDSVQDFQAGTPAATAVTAPGSVQLARVMKTEPFDGTALPAGYTATPWVDGGTATVAGGLVTVDRARLDAPRTYGPGQVLEFRAAFTQPNQHVGFGQMLATDTEPWAIVSTGGTGVLSARTAGAGGAGKVETPLTVADPTMLHTYRIEWTATDVRFFVDGGATAAATHPTAIAGELHPAASDFGADANLTIDSAALLLHADTGTFESRVLDASARAAWGKLTATVSGTGVAFATRSGDTATPGAGWSAYQPLGAGDAIQSPPARYLQYRATLSTADDRVTPSVERVDIGSTPAPLPAPAQPAGPPVVVAGTPSTPRGSGADAKAPRVTVGARTLHVSRRGVAKLSLRCPRDETSCTVSVRLKRGRTTAARKTVTLDGGETQRVRLRLSERARERLADRGRLQVTAVITARDAAGNVRKSEVALTLR